MVGVEVGFFPNGGDSVGGVNPAGLINRRLIAAVQAQRNGGGNPRAPGIRPATGAKADSSRNAKAGPARRP